MNKDRTRFTFAEYLSSPISEIEETKDHYPPNTDYYRYIPQPQHQEWSIHHHNVVFPSPPTNSCLLPQELYHSMPQQSPPSPIPDKKQTMARTRGRRVSNIPNNGVRTFACKTEGCGKVFKRSEHLKRHTRSIHTMEKPFKCPYQSCSKRFSRSDNLNQHIRIHRHTSMKSTSSSPPISNSSSTSTTSSSLSTESTKLRQQYLEHLRIFQC